MLELLPSTSVDLKDEYKSLNLEKFCELAMKLYPDDFTKQEKLHLKILHFEFDVSFHSELKNLSTILELCQGLVKIRKHLTYPLTYRLICLISTLPVSTARSERSFSAMKIVKNRLRNKM